MLLDAFSRQHRASVINVRCVGVTKQFFFVRLGRRTSKMAADSVPNVTSSVDHRLAVDAAMATVYAIICVGGLIGHALVLLVIVRDRHQPSHAVSNSYIASLSAADIGFLLGLPFIIATLTARRWLFGIGLCKVR